MASVSRPIWTTEARLSQMRSSLTAAIAARPIVSPESRIAARTRPGRACELVRATIEVALVAPVSSTADQPRLSSSEVST